MASSYFGFKAGCHFNRKAGKSAAHGKAVAKSATTVGVPIIEGRLYRNVQTENYVFPKSKHIPEEFTATMESPSDEESFTNSDHKVSSCTAFTKLFLVVTAITPSSSLAPNQAQTIPKVVSLIWVPPLAGCMLP